jgi:predicted dehydrogenase
MSAKARHILVIGCGSVGKRHARNLQSLGCRISGVDPRVERLEETASEIGSIGCFTSLEDALDRGGFDAAVVASPPTAHVEQASACLRRNLPVLLEKPVAPDLASALTLLDLAGSTRAAPVLLGYTFRWWEPVRRLRALVGAGRAGRVLRVDMVMAAHLADWHPWERYQDFFMAQAALGGGALLDESHFLDLMLWLFEWPRSLSATVEKLSSLEIDTDDNVDVNLALASGPRVRIHLDLYSRPHERSIKVYGDAGSIEWNNESNHVRTCSAATGTWDVESFTCERNDMFLAEVRHFLSVLDGTEAPLCTLADGCRVLQLVEAIRESAARKMTVTVPAPHGR